jgi:hypothetical protein
LKNLARWSPKERKAIQKHAAAITAQCAVVDSN